MALEIICISSQLHLYTLTFPEMKAKQIIGLIGILLFFIASVWMMHVVTSGVQKKKNQYATLPSFRLPDLNGAMITDTSIDRDKATLFYFFDPECNLCHTTIEKLKNRQEDFSGMQILLVTLISKEKVREFLDEIDFTLPENTKIILDENAELITLMDVKGPPTSLIYKDAKLIKRFDGPVKIETLIKYLR